MNEVIRLDVQTPLPQKLSFLNELTQNLWWSWSLPAQELLRRINPTLWDNFQRNPLVLMNFIKQKGWEELTRDLTFLEQLNALEKLYRHQVKVKQPQEDPNCVAYFSLEYGLHESLYTYSGGLGVLAGDYLKTASDLNFPLVAVGLYYHKGYFQQRLDQSGWQTEREQFNNHAVLPLKPVFEKDGSELRISVPLASRRLFAKAWRVDVGNVALYLLDTAIPENHPDLASISDNLYGGDRSMRLRQEILIGLGGIQLLARLGYNVQACHMNEGHSAFLSIARIAQLRREFSLNLEQAIMLHRSTTVFTTHTPVPAGNEAFDLDLLEPYLQPLLEDSGLNREYFLSWGFPPGMSLEGRFSMTILGCYTARFINGVSKLHGRVAQSMWHSLWPKHPQDRVPIQGITNGVHLPSWVSSSFNHLYSNFLGEDWLHQPRHGSLSLIDNIAPFDFWQAHIKHKAMLIRYVRQCAKEQAKRYLWSDNSSYEQNILHFDRLTIGFARRFATYKRANLLLHDPDRFERIIRNSVRPMQFIFAGKAHPADHPGKELIQRLIRFSRERNLTDSLVFLEDYGIREAKLLVQGVDVWLNNPIRPEEASGTSGMKAAINGVPNCSILDGWWAEGYHTEAGWAIRSSYSGDQNTRNRHEADSLYSLLENTIAPLYYQRDDDALPIDWTHMMKNAVKHALYRFSSHRMFKDYEKGFYSQCLKDYQRLTDRQAEPVKLLQRETERILAHFHKIKAVLCEPENSASHHTCYVDEALEIHVKVDLGSLKPEDVKVELYTGILSSKDNIIAGKGMAMKLEREETDGSYIFSYHYRCNYTGRQGLAIRIVPQLDFLQDIIPGQIVWAEKNNS